MPHPENNRLPPLKASSGRPIRNSYKSNNKGSRYNISPDTVEYADYLNAIVQGPFRNPIDYNITEEDNEMACVKVERDPHVFLEDLGSLSPEIIYMFLKESPQLLETFVKDYISIDKLENWLEVKVLEKFQEELQLTSLQGAGIPSVSTWRNTSCLERQNFMETFIDKVHHLPGDNIHATVLQQFAECCSSVVNATGVALYIADNESQTIWQYIEHFKPLNQQAIKEGTTIACYVAATLETVVTAKLTCDDRFPLGLGTKEMFTGAVICSPVILPSGEISGVVQLTRSSDIPGFTEKDNQIINGYLTWGGIVLHYALMYHGMRKQRKLNEFLLSVTRSIFQDIISMDTVIMKIMNFAQTLVDADRTALFLVDNATGELYARIFDIGTGLDTKLQKEIRFSKSKGVAGHVATTGETLNIKNAYDDPRFNRDIDHQTGYTTKTLLCMPIFIRGNIIGVVQMVNKKQGVFTDSDEKAFQTFAVYCGLALHHSKLYDKIRRSEQKYKVALEVLSYHSMCNENEISAVVNCVRKKQWEEINRYEFNVFDVQELEMASISIDMFHDLFESDSRFDIAELTRFVLTVRKNYRRVPYHNWTHAFTVAHCMYCVVKQSNRVVDGLEAVALYVACLCHDLDHRGKNNEWMKIEETPLASVYTTSTLEHHHFNQTVTILQHEGHDIFSKLSSVEYKRVLATVRDCILATDLATFFKNKAELAKVVNNGEFSWENEHHRVMFRALAMTCCDLSACAKPWKIQYETVKVIFQEFYAQGDEEKALGRKPVPMMDRDTADKLPNNQVGFLVGICIPGFQLLSTLVPGAAPLVEGAKKNLSVWSEMVKRQGEEKEKKNKEKKESEKEKEPNK